MFDEKVLWKERFARRNNELSKYLRYIFNGHIVIVMLFLLGTGAYYYQEWVKGLSPTFPVEIIMAVLLGLIVTHAPIYTFLMEADRIFLIPLEEKMSSYFKRSIFVSFLLQLYGLIIGLAVFMPMYAHIHGGYTTFLPFLLVLCAVKAFNLMIRWQVQYYVELSSHKKDSVVRYFVNAACLYLLFTQASLIFFIPVLLIYVGLYFFYYRQNREKGLKWEFLIDQEERRMMSFYRLANMFTDVPKLRDQVKRRKWLDWLMSFLKYKQEEAYMHLFLQTFIRGGDYFGIFARLTIIGMLALFFFIFGMGQILFVLLFLFLTGFQILPLWKHHQYKIWLSLYPIGDTLKVRSFKRLLLKILFTQSFFLSLPILFKGDWLIGILSLCSGVIFSYLFVYFYQRNKLITEIRI